MPADLDHFAPRTRVKSAKKGVRGRPTGPLAVDLGLTARDFRLQDIDPLLKFGDPEHLQVLANGLDQALTAANSDFRRLFHDEHYLSGSPLGRYPTALSRQAQVCEADPRTALPEPST
jgi:hypothetical protein